MIELVVALAVFAAAVLPLSFLLGKERNLCRAYYSRAVAMEIVDSEMEILVAGEWQRWLPGTHAYPVACAAAQNLPPGGFRLTLDDKRLRLEWKPDRPGMGGAVVREAMLPSATTGSRPRRRSHHQNPRTTTRTRTRTRTRTNGYGYMLIECMAYIAILSVVLTLSFSAVGRTHRNALDLRRNADDIERTLKAGERWRADVRAAIAEPAVANDGETLLIRQARGDVRYRLADGAVWRETNDGKTLAMKGVKASRFVRDARQFVTAWGWEVELNSPQKVVRVRPLFMFQAVPKEAK